MKLNNLTPIVLSAAALCAGSISLSAATSGVVGATTFDIPTGPSIVSVPFLKAVQAQGAVVGVSGADVELASIPALSGANYIHVLSGSDVGMVYDIASVSGAVATLTEAPAGLLAGDTVAIRPHMTLGDLGTPPLFTSATFLNAGGVPELDSYTFLGWGNPAAVIYPGEGVVINNSTVWTVTLYGSVSEDDVIFSAATGAQIVGNIDPVDGSTDVLASVIAGAPAFTSLTELDVNNAGAVVNYSKTFLGWSPDPSVIDVTDFKSFIINVSGGIDIVNAGMVIAP